jgi:hypothetical protein
MHQTLRRTAHPDPDTSPLRLAADAGDGGLDDVA